MARGLESDRAWGQTGTAPPKQRAMAQRVGSGTWMKDAPMLYTTWTMAETVSAARTATFARRVRDARSV
jgi:hypothetical protein